MNEEDIQFVASVGRGISLIQQILYNIISFEDTFLSGEYSSLRSANKCARLHIY